MVQFVAGNQCGSSFTIMDNICIAICHELSEMVMNWKPYSQDVLSTTSTTENLSCCSHDIRIARDHVKAWDATVGQKHSQFVDANASLRRRSGKSRADPQKIAKGTDGVTHKSAEDPILPFSLLTSIVCAGYQAEGTSEEEWGSFTALVL